MSLGSAWSESERLNVADRVVRDLEANILSGGLPRGSRLPTERELAAHYGVSAPTIREAIRALSAMKLVEVKHGSGTTVIVDANTLMAAAMGSVVELEGVDLPSILRLSETLNLQAVERAIEVASDEEVAALREVAASFDESMPPDTFLATLRAFLDGLFDLSHDRLLQAVAAYVVSTHLSLAQQARSTQLSSWARDVATLRELRLNIVDGIAARDRHAAIDAVRAMTQRTLAIDAASVAPAISGG
ncbi:MULTISPECIES: FadR/GntR family transcriptional regulator [unclassified Microbacterium]|uniref:FadR/GntR family transcriptional regulator n=1 Tax=unclassified Microbacterium TaxID=2609290 RepID=UPI003652BB0A